MKKKTNWAIESEYLKWKLPLSSTPVISIVFFFFQAEDGIRALYVTGVQTCALPICLGERAARHRLAGDDRGEPAPRHRLAGRSEERRVGEECSSRWSPEH